MLTLITFANSYLMPKFLPTFNMCRVQYAVYEREPRHGKEENNIILAPFDTKEDAEKARAKYGYSDDNYYVDKLIEELKYYEVKVGMIVKDELGRIGKVVGNDDIDNIKIFYAKEHFEYVSLRPDNPDGISKLYRHNLE